MPIDCDPRALAQAASCLQACVNAGMADAIKIYLLAQIAGVDPDPDALIKAGSCLQCAIPPGMAPAVQASLLCQIANAGGGGGQCGVVALPDNNTYLTQIGFEGQRDFPNLVGVTSVEFAAVTSIANYRFSDCDQLEALLFPNLVTLGNLVMPQCNIEVRRAAAFTTFSAPLLVSLNCTNSPFRDCLVINECPLLTSVDLPSLVLNMGAMRIWGCTALTTISVPLWVPSDGFEGQFDGNALLAASVNQILARHVANPTWGNGGEFLLLDGGTNAAPSGQGILDKATLIGRGATVNTN